MKKIIIVLLILATTNESTKTGKIVNGYWAFQGEFPYMASLKITPTKVVCGGSILNNRWILSAAQCKRNIYYIDPPNMIGVGNTDLSLQTNYDIQKFIIHPHFDDYQLLNDVMLVKTNKTIKFVPGVSPIMLNTNTKYDSYMFEKMKIAGWGQTNGYELNRDSSQNLLWLYYTMKTNNTCFEINNSHGVLEYDQNIQFCAQVEGTYSTAEPGACFKDFGAPLVYGYVQYGILNRFVATHTYFLCAYHYIEDVFTRVSKFIPWIKQTISTN